jgi:hypothetical protein
MSILSLFRRAVAPSKSADCGDVSAVPRTLSKELLVDVTGACELPVARDEQGRRECWRVPIGTRATLRMCGGDSAPISIIVRDISAIGIGLLFEKPLNAGERFWIYLPKPAEQGEIVGLCCVAIRSDRGGAFKELYVIGATFVEGDAPPLPKVPKHPHELVPNFDPNRFEEEGGLPPIRAGSHIFLQSHSPYPQIETSAIESGRPLEEASVKEAPAEAYKAASIEIPPVVKDTNQGEPVRPAPIKSAIESVAQIEEAGTQAALRQAEVPINLPAAPPPSTASQQAMDSEQSLSADQRQRIARVVKRELNYLNRLVKRMEQMGVAAQDPTLSKTLAARTAVEQLFEQLLQNGKAGQTRSGSDRKKRRSSRRKANQPKQVVNNFEFNPADNFSFDLSEDFNPPSPSIHRETVFSIDSKVNSAVKNVQFSMPRWSVEVADVGS